MDEQKRLHNVCHHYCQELQPMQILIVLREPKTNPLFGRFPFGTNSILPPTHSFYHRSVLEPFPGRSHWWLNFILLFFNWLLFSALSQHFWEHIPDFIIRQGQPWTTPLFVASHLSLLFVSHHFPLALTLAHLLAYLSINPGLGLTNTVSIPFPYTALSHPNDWHWQWH